MIINIDYLTTQSRARIPLTHKGDVWLIIGRHDNIHKFAGIKDVYISKEPGYIVHFMPTATNGGDYIYNCEIDVKLTDSMFVYLGGNTAHYKVC